ncbi:hypothetical protein [Vibrio astriarenae]|nr:hypothetical protein [Vibrio astriarenae]
MKVDKKTMTPILITACVTLVILGAINNVDAFKPVSDQINGKKGWF